MEQKNEILDFLGLDLVDAFGQRLGTIDGFYLDEDGTPLWVAVVSGGAERPVPLVGAESVGTGLRVGYAKDLVVNAPACDLSTSSTWPSALGEHFGVGAPL